MRSGSSTSGSAVVADRGHDRGPTHPEVPGDLGHGVPVTADTSARVASGSFAQRRPRPDLRMLFGPGSRRAVRILAAPHPLRPHQHHWPATRRQIPHPDLPAVMRRCDRPARRAAHQGRCRLDELVQLAVDDGRGEHHEPAQSKERGRARTTRRCLPRGLANGSPPMTGLQ